ncbi:glycoside hydrolase family 95 protein [Butyrivibrio sp. XPD2002]|uniref:glycoside hydrolase family 95 protein n=1 Tax=Butyrivibrio sp. XPD2002 TaxID=1280665 RepID=UPI0004167B2C|nr:glycoside hydrolase family 95 protein [Butyrivibrio sp. XPD2002]
MEKNLSLWYEQPASKWEEALPVGNGRLGAMVMGGVSREVIYLNEDSIWSGKPTDRINKDARKYLDEIRKLIRQGRIPEAEKLSLLALSGTPNSERSYETAGEFVLEFDGVTDYKNYKRELDLETGCALVSYEADGIKYTREFIASFPDQIMAYHLKAEGGKLNLTARLDRCHNRLDEVWAETDEIGFRVETGTGIPFAVGVKARVTDGEVFTIGEHLVVKDASEVLLLIDFRTEFYCGDYDYTCGNTRAYLKNDSLNSEDKAGSVINNVDYAAKKSWSDIFADHVSEFRRGFGTLSLRLGDDIVDRQCLPTDKRLQALKNGEKDPDLFALYFQYGRYLLFSSSRGKCLPANLQGIWNNSMTPPWDGKFTININAEMNYWIAESGNLSECHMPFFYFLKRVCDNGKKTAKEMYGCRGSVAHHNSDIYADTAPQDHYIPATFWVMGEAWMATHIWEHYLYTGDREFLRNYFEIMSECVDFFEDFLIENELGELVTSPSVSPENVYIMEDGTRGCLCEGATMDIEILMELLNGYIDACEVLGVNDKAVGKVRKILERLPKIKIGKYGQIQEWMEDYDELEPGHRHISHLYGVYPGSSISYEKTPELMDAARVTLERRLANGGGHTGWSRAWIIGLWAHFLEGEKVYENLEALLCQGTFDNMMDNHPYGAGAVFQIDGNLGASAAILEMLVQCRDGYVKLLPALPKEFSEGSISGVCLRGGFELSMEWKDMKVTNWEITRRKSGNDHMTNDAGSKDERFSNTSNAGKGLTELTVLVNGEEQVLKL